MAGLLVIGSSGWLDHFSAARHRLSRQKGPELPQERPCLLRRIKPRAKAAVTQLCITLWITCGQSCINLLNQTRSRSGIANHVHQLPYACNVGVVHVRGPLRRMLIKKMPERLQFFIRHKSILRH